MNSPVGIDFPVATIIKTVEEHFGLDAGDIKRRDRPKPLGPPRHVAFWLARDLTGYSWPRLGRLFNREKSTIRHVAAPGTRISLNTKRRSDPELDAACRQLRARLAVDLDVHGNNG